MGNELITRDQLQSDLENLYNNKISPYLNGATHTGFTPVGTIISYFGETAPTHYLICDGTTYNKSDYPELWTHLSSLTDTTPYVVDGDNTKFKVPDLRGEFLRGTGTNGHTNQGSGGDVGEHQDSTDMPNFFFNSSSFGQVRGTGTPQVDAEMHNFDSEIGSPTNKRPQGTLSMNTMGTEGRPLITIRPTNTSVLFCIAYKDIYIDYALDGFPVAISNPQDKQGLTFDATTQKWVNGAGGMHEYSTTEKVVGTWIDGRPIYEKIIELSNGSGFPTITNIIENANELIGSYDILFKRQVGNYYQSIGFFYSVNDYCFPYIAIDTSTHYIQFITCESGGTYSKTIYYRAVVRYTKTTDTPTV